MLMTAIDAELFRNFAIALFIGGLVGIERERKSDADDLQFGGLRTFILIAMAGAICAWIDRETGSGFLFIAGACGLTLLIAVSYWAAAQRAARLPGITTEMSGIVVYLLGGGTLFGYPEVTVALAIITSGILTYKTTLHNMVDRLDVDDLYAGLKLLFATFIVLPLLPDRPLDPWGSLNPYILWWLVILISSLSLVGYVAVRWLGPERGLAVTGFFGGLVSSTAMTLSFARRSKLATDPPGLVAMGILLAWTVMSVRVMIAVSILNPGLVMPLLPAIGALGVASLGSVAFFYMTASRREVGPDDETPSEPTKLKNPFSLGQAMKFGALFAVVLLAVALAREFLPTEYIYVVAFFAGLTDVDAISLSLASAAGEDLAVQVAVIGIIIAALANTWTKAAVVMTLGSRAVSERVAVATAVMTVASLGALAGQWML
jgi:uncharacterized membrane protein (DUF4010 family)